MVSGLRRGLKQCGTKEWPSVEGEIIETSISKYGRGGGPDSPVIYQFSLSGRIYRSSRVIFISRNVDISDWIQLANGLPEREPIPVYYNPDNPSESVLIKGNAKQSWGEVKSGAIFASFAIVWISFWWILSNWLPDRLTKEEVQANKPQGASGDNALL